MIPAELKPTTRNRVIDIVKATGIPVNDWANYDGGNPATNPKYCYNWCFRSDDGKIILLNLWYDKLENREGKITQQINCRSARATPKWTTRAKAMDDALQTAYLQSLPVRVAICDGRRADIPEQTSKASRRLLDSESWAVTAYDEENGNYTLTRGVTPTEYVDQFAQIPEVNESAKKHPVVGQVFERSAMARKTVLIRAKGRCEHCGKPGFKTQSGALYLETHHIIPLSENGQDKASNMIALCADDHRQAHYAHNHAELRLAFLKRIQVSYGATLDTHHSPALQSPHGPQDQNLT